MPPSVIKRYKQGLLGNDDKAFEKPIFFTNCCRRPICPSCIIANARLVRYDPCLHCLGGVDVVASGMASISKLSMATDQDLFVLGDDDEDAEALPQVGPPPCEAARRATEVEINTVKQGDGSIEPNSSQKDPTPVKHYLTPSDTLQGISLRYGVNGYDLCQLNNLPPSTLTTMPKLLHTRTYILLPFTSVKSLLSQDSAMYAKRKTSRKWERAKTKTNEGGRLEGCKRVCCACGRFLY
ncbi:hypothetical protein AX14_002915 [Amanita brunnescens Koide BX004]|nr:hypothetical protein AX14_002915 [Amanita brunnescens Koide BX004]